MALYKLKPGQEAFQVVDGPCEGRSYQPGVVYTEADIPPQEAKRFQEILEQSDSAPVAETKPKAKKETP